MKIRTTAFYVTLFTSFVVILVYWTRTPEVGESETADAESRDNEAQTFPPIPEENGENEGARLSDLPGPPFPLDSNEPSLVRSSSGPIPFESVSMSELEEVNLANAGEPHSHKIREWKGRLQPGLRALKDKLNAEGEEGVIAISLPDASQVQVTRMRFESFGPNQGVITGRILGDTFGEVVLSYVNQAVAGSIRDYRNDKVWEIRNAGEGRQYIAQVDVAALGECGVCKEHGVRAE